jgi:hypothetical protein
MNEKEYNVQGTHKRVIVVVVLQIAVRCQNIRCWQSFNIDISIYI